MTTTWGHQLSQLVINPKEMSQAWLLLLKYIANVI